MDNKHSQRQARADSPLGRRRRSVAGLRRGDTIIEPGAYRRVEYRVAPPRYAERHHARPGAGTKRARAAMIKPRQKR